MENFVVSSAPYKHSGNDINKMFLYMAIALVIPGVFAVVTFGFYSLVIILLSLASCLLSECLFNLITKKKFLVYDFSFFVTGMVLALTMPHKIPFYFVIAAGFVSIFVTKMAFGGLGRNKFNPALVGRCFVGLLSSSVATEFYKMTINGDVYVSLTEGGTNTLYNILMGKSVGGIGTTCVIVIVICFVALVYTGVIDFKIPVISILTYFILGLIVNGFEPTLMDICSGSFLFVSIFMMTDPNTSPNTLVGKIIYSGLFGALSFVLWNTGKLGENTVFAVALFVNLLVPIMDKYLVAKPLTFGGMRNAYKD